MTSSFGITPQRQRRSQEVRPAEPDQVKAPDQPYQQQRRGGGQLLDHSSFQPDKAAFSAFQQIENFLQEGGVWDNATGRIHETYKKGAKEKADKLRQTENFYKSAAKAYDAGEKNAKATQLLEKKGEFEKAKENRLNDPWVNFYYWDAVSDDVGRNAALELKAWGSKDINHLARLDETQRGLAIQEKANQILQGSEEIPKNFRTAKIDKYIASVSWDLKQAAFLKSKEFVIETDQKTALKKLEASWNTAGIFSKVPNGEALAATNIPKGIVDYRNYLIDIRGYDKKEATEFLAQAIKNGSIFIDTDNNQLNDIGEWGNMKMIFDSLKDLKFDGIPFLKLQDSESVSMRKHLEQAFYKAGQMAEFVNTQYDRKVARGKKEIDHKLEKEGNKFWLKYHNYTGTDFEDIVQQQREKVKEEMKAAAEAQLLPPGVSLTEALKMVDDMYPIGGTEMPPLKEERILQDAREYIALTQDTEIPQHISEQVAGTTAAVKVQQLFGEARAKLIGANRSAISANVASDYKIINDDLDRILGEDEEIKRKRTHGGQSAKDAERLIKEAKTRMQLTLKSTLEPILNKKYTEAVLNGVDITNAQNRARIQQEVIRMVENDPTLSDINAWTNVRTGETKKVPDLGIVELGYETKQIKGKTSQVITKPHVIEITDTDSAFGWSMQAATAYAGKGDLYKSEVLDRTIVIPEPYLKEFSHALSGGEDIVVSEQARKWLHNISETATDGDVKAWEALKSQLNLYEGNTYDRGLFPEEADARLRQIASLINSVDIMSGHNISDVGIRMAPVSDGDSQAIDFVLERVGDKQLANNVPTPISGTVVYVGEDEKFGVNVVISAGIGGTNNKKGSLIRISNLARTSLTEGTQLTRGQTIGLQGDGSDINSIQGQSSTGLSSNPGHVRFQMYHPGTGPNPTEVSAYSLYRQRTFWNQMFPSIYKKKQVDSRKQSALNTPKGQPLPPG